MFVRVNRSISWKRQFRYEHTPLNFQLIIQDKWKWNVPLVIRLLKKSDRKWQQMTLISEANNRYDKYSVNYNKVSIVFPPLDLIDISISFDWVAMATMSLNICARQNFYRWHFYGTVILFLESLYLSKRMLMFINSLKTIQYESNDGNSYLSNTGKYVHATSSSQFYRVMSVCKIITKLNQLEATIGSHCVANFFTIV